MFATHNYVISRGVRLVYFLTLLALIRFTTVVSAVAEEAHPPRWAEWTAHAQTKLTAAQQHFAINPTNNEAAWQFARATFDRAEFAANDSERAGLAVQGIDACRKVIERDPKSAPAHYYLALNLGQLARTKLLGALKIVDEMEREFKITAGLDEKLDYAGPARGMAQLYYEAPVIGSIGSRSKARKSFENAVELAPGFPENHLNLAEAYLKWREKKLLKHELDALDTLWPEAKKTFNGPDWAAPWNDWEKRKSQLAERAKDLLK